MKHSISKSRLWTARVMSGLVTLFMLFDGITKLLKLSVSVDGMVEMGFAEHHVITIGILALLSTILYALPQTSVLGAIILTGFFGGVIATHIRLDNPLFSHTLFPVYLAVLTWGGIYLRDKRLQIIFPIKQRRQITDKNDFNRTNMS
ncbi:DoxX family protein [Fictibacillus terranigra]|uniref:DoxX family protein n=1 Tax=Fictibacillus terranigra TaxID=3058424 RepID=A0ABT8E4T3_9BACL|nr:DoxX family protein [Fictibacillus sp. CENA-BCM004]MDN4072922.1 DoxX family protein [Fictibacillus sp. CENA-BCM004]